MASLKALKIRINSVKSTQKITKAMKMVAAAKLRRAQDAAEAARPYAERLEAVVSSIASKVEKGPQAPKLLAGTGKDDVHLFVVCTSDKGLAGAFNTNIVRLARRRADEEISKARKFAVEGFADSLLPVLDSLEAGLAIQSATPEQIREGAEATLRQLKSALERNKVVEINPTAGTKFDPHHHQAISVVPAQQEANTVVTVLQKGYLIADRVLRPALVTVSAPK